MRRGALAAWEGAPTKLRRVVVGDGGDGEKIVASVAVEEDKTEGGKKAPAAKGGKGAGAADKGGADALAKAREETAAAKAEAKRWATLYGELHAAAAKDLE